MTVTLAWDEGGNPVTFSDGHTVRLFTKDDNVLRFKGTVKEVQEALNGAHSRSELVVALKMRGRTAGKDDVLIPLANVDRVEHGSGPAF